MKLRKWCLLVIFSGMALFAYADDPIQPQYKGEDADAVDRAKNLRLQQKFDAAIELLLPIVKREPEYYRALYQLALSCGERAQSPARQENDVENADKWFRQAINLKERLAAEGKPLNEYTIYNSYGWFLMETGRFKEAEINLLKGVNERDKLPSVQSQQRVLNNLAIVYKRQGRFEESAEASKKAVEIGSQTAQKNLNEVQQMVRIKK